MNPQLFYDEVTEIGHLLLAGEKKLSKGADMFLERVIELLMQSEVELDKERCFVRAQKGGNLVQDCWLDENQEIPGIRAFQEDRMIPNLNVPGEGRFHREGQAGFYFAAEVETAG